MSSPIVWGDRVFVSTAISSDPNQGIRTGQYGDVEPVNDASKHTWRLIALDKATGKVVWDKVAYEGVPKTKRHPKSSQASATPVTDGRHVIVSFGSQGLYAYDFDGKLLWQKDLGVLNSGWFFDPDYEWGIGSSPIIYKNMVIVQCDIQRGLVPRRVRHRDRQGSVAHRSATRFRRGRRRRSSRRTARRSWSRRPRRSRAATIR